MMLSMCSKHYELLRVSYEHALFVSLSIFNHLSSLNPVYYFFFQITEFEKVKNDDKEKETVSDKFRKELERERMMKIEAINKLAEIMQRRDVSKKKINRGNAIVLQKKEKECKKLQQELSRVSCIVVQYHRVSIWR